MPTREPPYLQIVTELRQRMASGELPPGARLPSTRELARKWKVAIATAAHALKTLAHEGAVKAVPRVGTVVAGARSARPLSQRREVDLTAEEVVSAAIAIADAEGLAALSIRGVAAKVGVPVMSLYRYVRSKDELLERMADAALGEEPLQDPPPSGWRAQLELATRSEWRTFRRHPWLARVVCLTRPQPLPNALAFANWVMRALEGLGLTAVEKMHVHLVLHSYVQGLAANLELEAEAASQSGMSEQDWMRAHEDGFARLAASGRLPHFAKLLAGLSDGFDLDFDELFEVGLRIWLDGLEAKVSQRGKRSAARPPHRR